MSYLRVLFFLLVLPIGAQAFFFKRELTDDEKVEKLWESARGRYSEIYDTSKNPNERIFSQLLADFSDSYQEKFEPVVTIHEKTYQPAEKNEWNSIAQLNQEAAKAWKAVLECVGYERAANKAEAIMQAKQRYGQNKLCPEATRAVRNARMQLKNFLFTSDVRVPSRSFPDLKFEAYASKPLFTGGINFHPFFMELVIEEMTLGFRPYDIAYCFLGTLKPTNCQGYNYDIKHWTNPYTHKNGAYWRKIQGEENYQKRALGMAKFDQLDRNDPEVAQLLASLNAISIFNLLRRSSDRACAQWGLWPNYTYMVAAGVSILSNLHGIFTDTLVPEQLTVSQDCKFDMSLASNSSGISWGALMMLNLEIWKEFTEFQQKHLTERHSRFRFNEAAESR